MSDVGPEMVALAATVANLALANRDLIVEVVYPNNEMAVEVVPGVFVSTTRPPRISLRQPTLKEKRDGIQWVEREEEA